MVKAHVLIVSLLATACLASPAITARWHRSSARMRAPVTLGSGTLLVSGQASVRSSNETVNETHLSVSGSLAVAAGATVELDSTAGGSPGAGNPDGGVAYLNVAGSLVNIGALVTQVEDPAWATRCRPPGPRTLRAARSTSTRAR